MQAAKLFYSSAVLLCSFTLTSRAQSFTPDVIGSAGTFASSASASMSWTVGEVMTETYSSAGNFFTQGFHQPDTAFVTAVTAPASQNISIYPNPVVDNLIIVFAGEPGNHSLYMYDMLGNKMYEAQTSHLSATNNSTLQGKGQRINISFREFANGIYLLNIINSESNIHTSFKINKVE